MAIAGRSWLVAALILSLLLPAFAPRRAAGAGALAPQGLVAYQGTDGKLHVVDADGRGDRVVPTRGAAFAPHWSPFGAELVYYDELADQQPQGELVALDPATGAVRVLVAPELRDPGLGTYWSYLQPRWSHDGRAVFYLLGGGGRTTTLMRVSAAGGTPEELVYGVNTTRFDVSPLDSRLAVVDNAFSEERVQGSRLLLLDPDGTNERTILPRAGVYYYQPTWTPDGRWIAVRRQPGPNSPTSSLIVVNPATGQQRTIGALPGGSAYTFSPDGKWLVYAAAESKRVTVVNLDDFNEQRALASGVTPAWGPSAARTFPETGYRVGGRFLDYWNAHGGLAINGFPISPARDEVLEDGRTYTVQWFERVRLEYHPGNPAPYDVLLGQFGRRIHGGVDPRVAAQPGARFFPETGHNVAGDFLAYWEGEPSGSGGLAQFGFPLTEVITQTLEDKRSYRVQYFERARFELHPEEEPPYRVLLGQFGRRILAETRR